MEITLFVEGHGFGHAARNYRLAKELNAKVITFGDGARFFREKGLEVIEIKKPYPLKFNEEEFDLLGSLTEIIKLFDINTIKLINNEIKDSSLVIVDSSLLGLIMGRINKKKTFFISNNTDLSIFFQGENKKKIIKRSSSKLLELADKVFICDFPPPYTISKDNIHVSNSVEFIGPLVDVRDIKKKSIKEVGVVSLGASNLEEYKDLFNALDELSLNHKVVGKIKTKKVEKIENPRDYYKNARWIISHGGHSTIMEAILLGIPLLLIPQKNYKERINNSKAVERLGLGKCLDIDYISKWNLEVALDEIERNRDKNLWFKEFANKLDGVKRIKEFCEENL